MSEVVLKVEHLSQHFRLKGTTLKAVDDISFEVRKGEVFGLVGESGCGKTTTGRTIIKLYKATKGNVYLNDKMITGDKKLINNEIFETKQMINKLIDPKDKSVNETKINELNEKLLILKKQAKTNKQKYVPAIQMIFQDPIASLNPRMTVFDIIAEGMRINGIKYKDVLTKRIYNVLELVGLRPEHANRYPHEFSGGQRQRIGIARSLVLNPDLLIADEPISALDVSIQAQIISLLNELRSKIGLTILFIAHNMSVVKYFCDRIGVMYYGKLVEMAPTEELFKRPLHPYTRSLLSAIPYPDPNIEKSRKRIVYNPIIEHNYTEDKPQLVEVYPDHYVYCNEIERKKLLDK